MRDWARVMVGVEENLSSANTNKSSYVVFVVFFFTGKCHSTCAFFVLNLCWGSPGDRSSGSLLASSCAENSDNLL